MRRNVDLLMAKIQAGAVPTGSTILGGRLVTGDYGYALIAFPVAHVLVIATTDDRSLRASRFVGRSYLLTDARERSEAREHLERVYEATTGTGRDELDLLVMNYVGSLSEKLDTVPVARGVAFDTDELYERIVRALRQVGHGQREAEHTAERFCTMDSARGHWAVFDVRTHPTGPLPSRSHAAVVRIAVRYLGGERYRYEMDIRAVPEATVKDRQLFYSPLSYGDRGLAFGRYLAMRDRIVRRKMGIGWKLPIVLLSAYTELPWGSVVYAHPGAYWGYAASVPQLSGSAVQLSARYGRICLYIRDDEYDHLISTAIGDDGDALRQDGWNPHSDPSYVRSSRFFGGRRLEEIGIAPCKDISLREPYSAEAVELLAAAYDDGDVSPDELRAVLYEDRVLAALGGEL